MENIQHSDLNSFNFFTNLIHLILFLHLQSLAVFLYMFRTDRSIIRRIKCLITQAASGTVPSVVDLSCVAVGVRLRVIKHLILLMRDRSVRNM
jgi:hypothetical protein